MEKDSSGRDKKTLSKTRGKILKKKKREDHSTETKKTSAEPSWFCPKPEGGVKEMGLRKSKTQKEAES